MRIQTQMRRRLAGRRSAGRRSALEAAVSVLVALGIVLGVRAAMGVRPSDPLRGPPAGRCRRRGTGRRGRAKATEPMIGSARWRASSVRCSCFRWRWSRGRRGRRLSAGLRA